ncbi:hypothetical protein QTI51_09465 [Variovorax sp. J22G73]|uniref:hypothetical protein n=1 Tax=unclassified Variovorax TaxID=663243 RepID=UPI0025783F8B|nr:MULTISPECIES: hypothetical protein [unclassified Variovorax]MDM0006472.1 hypothetical protein [Variovorax sp. J22R203]MDM0097504.1 hypothetical protein [Variovorax sp. J22G73]
MTKLTYTNDMQLIDAFKNGAKFVVREVPSPVSAPRDFTVTAIEEGPGGQLTVRYMRSTGPTQTKAFRPDGTHKLVSHRTLVQLTAGKTTAPSTNTPFLKAFVNGEPAYNPATREVVESVAFKNGAIVVTFVGGRTSDRYDHEGRHRWQPKRSLVLGPLPPVKVKKTLRIYHDKFYGGYLTLDENQVLPNSTRFIGAKPLATVEVEV